MTNVDLGRYKRIVQYFWDPEPKNDEDSKSPIWCLGSQYAPSIPPPQASPTGQDPISPDRNIIQGPLRRLSQTIKAKTTDDDLAYDETSNNAEQDRGWPSPFLDDFESRIWMSYRSGFPAIAKSPDPKASSAMTFTVRLRSQLMEKEGFTSDAGFGCMIRSGQALLANALVMLRLGRDWRRDPRHKSESNIISLFADDPRAPFSIHRFVEHGATACGKHPGEWFGPSATARCIEALSNDYPSTGLRVYITGDGSDVYEDAFMRTAKPKPDDTFIPTIVLVGIRLGIDRVTLVYWEALKASLQMPQSLGIAGGRPSSSHYFIGVQGSNFFYLDPHQTRPAIPFHSDPSAYTTEEIDSCHTRRLRRLNITEMDPSMLIAFLIRDENDWKDWRSRVSQPALSNSTPGGGVGKSKAVIHVADEEPANMHGKGNERAGALDEVEILSDEDDEEDADGVKIDASESDSGRVEALDDSHDITVDLSTADTSKIEAVDEGDGVKVDLSQSEARKAEPADEGDGVKVDLSKSDISKAETTDESDGVKV